MIKLDFYRAAFIAVVIGLFNGVSAQAQTVSNGANTSESSAVFAANINVAGEPAVAPAALRLSQPPAPDALAAYYDGSHKDLHQSLAWMLETNAAAPTYWNLYTEARIRLQLQDYTGAQAAAEQAYKLALKAMPLSQDYVVLSAAVVAKAHELASR